MVWAVGHVAREPIGQGHLEPPVVIVEAEEHVACPEHRNRQSLLEPGSIGLPGPTQMSMLQGLEQVLSGGGPGPNGTPETHGAIGPCQWPRGVSARQLLGKGCCRRESDEGLCDKGLS